MDITTGAAQGHDPLLPYDPGLSPGVASPTEVVPGNLTGPTVDGRDTTGERLAQMTAAEADVRAAQASGMTAEHNRRAHYSGANTDPVDLPPVPSAALPATQDDYPKPGDEPFPQ